ncbi:MAG: SDR family NAD(P)-dependent oxidoreductase [Candidatus Marinimicrobia bacterium]|jgi:short-subunit dehydrogenase|nr:SDR family NAD(P)-dependent oxidoreductase [Candidatus Neomarinimicrobiota bacterium]|tara:strand:+ start:1660 stop:2466 length:807 start_codon:yes stop_codon:yes gene_type:complete
MKRLDGKTAVVTGNSRGIGPYISRTLAREGVTIVGVARSEDGLAATQREIEAEGGKCYSIAEDLSQVSSIPQVIERAVELAGEIDILVNNAGREKYQYFHENRDGDIAAILDVNLYAPMELTRLLLPGMLECGGHVVNVASLGGKKGIGYNSIYSASKAGMIMWSDGLRQELRGTKVGISVICPGYISDEGMFADGGIDAPALLGTSSPQKVANAVLDAILKGKPEIIVNNGPMRPLLAIGQLFPSFADAVVRWFGVPELSRKRIESE